MPKLYDESKIKELARRHVFFDANILLYVFWPTASPKVEKQYSWIFNCLRKQGNRMVVDFIVISEVVNRAVKIEYEKHLQNNSTSKEKVYFKKYRDSRDGQGALTDIFNTLKKSITNSFEITGKAFTKTDIENFLSIDSLDFSDKGIEAICKENNFVLLTNDKDFGASDLEILTANRNLLGKHA